MNIYLDASAVLRLILLDPARIRDWGSFSTKVTSALLEVECLRTLDNLKLRGAVREDELPGRRAALHDILSSSTVLEVTGSILLRASEPLPTPLRTLDAIHLASAMTWRETHAGDLTMATHDEELAKAARGKGLEVIGV
ncbi:MAG: type II toxin-antitoxin system VapC family toxin [Candidatus Coatesbacteria bacterium]